MTMKASILRLTGAALLSVFVAACGGGGGGGGVVAGGTGGTGIASGQITDFGSIFVNGVEFDCRGGSIESDDDTVSASSSGDDVCNRARTQGLLSKGMVVSVEGSIDASGASGRATKVRFRNDFQGPISVSNIDLANNTITVAGQTILIDDATKFEIGGTEVFGLAGLQQLSLSAANTVIEVSGLPNGSGQLLATHIETKPGLGNNDFEIKGTASVNGATITLGNLTISVGNFSNPAITNGACVELKGTISGNTLTLTRAPHRDDDCDGLRNSTGTAHAEVEGIVNGFTTATSQFKVGLQAVAVSTSTVYRNGVVDDLADGVKVEAEGPIASGVLNAAKITFKPGVRLEANADANGSANALGIAVSTTASTRLKGGLTIASIQAGDCLRIRGFKVGAAAIIAQEIERRSGNACSRTELRGPVEAKTPETSFTILGVPVTTGAGTEYNGTSNGAARTAFYNALTINGIAKARGVETPDNAIDATGDEAENEDD
jgi:hypothetical protein